MDAPAQRSVAIAIYAPLRPEDLPGLVARTSALLDGSACDVLHCEVAAVAADAVAVDALARVALAAHRHGCAVVLQGASEEMLALVALIGLRGILASAGAEVERAPGEVKRGLT
jgi:ABC-type transporter Mla MlaB component